MKSNRRSPGGAPRASSRRAGSPRSEDRQAAQGGGPRPGAGAGLWIVLLGAPILVLVAILVLKSRAPQAAATPVVQEKSEYDRSRRLRDQAQPHISAFFRAKRVGDSGAMSREFQAAKEKLEEAQTILEKLKMRYTDDHTLDGNLPDAYYYLDQELSELSEDYIQIIREKDVGE